MLLIIGFLAASIIVLWTYVRIKMHHTWELGEKIPGPKPLPILGNMLEFGTSSKDIFNDMNRITKQYEGIFRIWFGFKLGVVISDPIYVEPVISANNILDKAWSYTFVEPWLGTGILTGTGQKWKNHRKLIVPTFHVKILEQNVDMFNSNADILINQLSKHENGPEFDIFPYIMMCALDNICETAMGVKVNAQQDSDSEYVKAIKSMCDSILLRSFRPWLYNDFLFSLSSLGRLQKRCLATLHGMTKNVIESRKKELLETKKQQKPVTEDNENTGKKRVAFLDLLIQSSQDGALLTDEEIREEVDTIMFAGHDTTGTATSFMCWLLANHQHVQDKVLSELKEILGNSDRVPSFQDLQEMKYMEQVIKETLRLYPSVPLYGRTLTEDLQVEGYVFPAGTSVFFLAYITHRSPKYFPDPEKFDPDRFLPENILNRNPYCYIPFAAGPRNCVGQKYGMFEIKAIMCQLLRRFKLLPGDTPLDITSEIVLKSATGVNIRLQPR